MKTYCPICGEKTYNNRIDLLCYEHGKMRDNEQIEKCILCDNWKLSKQDCPCFNAKLKPTSECIICNSEANGYLFCYDCYNKNKYKDLYFKISKCRIVEQIEKIDNNNSEDPRKKNPANKRCSDGHYVRSKAEQIIDNWLYNKGIIHAYEQKVFFSNREEALCDFYIPEIDTYIEFWGDTDDEYERRKREKISLYKKNQMKLIEIDDNSLENIDDLLNKMVWIPIKNKR